MRKSFWLLSACAVSFAAPALAQDGNQSPQDSATQAGAVDASEEEQPEIIVTGLGREQVLQDVPVAVSVISAESIQNTGATDIRQLNQVTPSLYVSSTTSEAGASGAGIRGIRTVGDNPGLESSVATFIDGVYRNRGGVALTELGPIERAEILRGPQGTLFGRNASAGIISIVTAQPKFDFGAYGEATYGSYDMVRIGAGVTGPLAESVAARIDGVYLRRDGFLEDVISGRQVNDRDRYLVRGKLLFEPSDTFSVTLSGDYAERNEECCAATYLPARDATRLADGSVVFGPSSIANLIRSINSVVPGAGLGQVLDDTYDRKVAITPGRDFSSDVREWGVQAEITADLGFGRLTSITAYRDFDLVRGIDGDFNNLDILARDSDGGYFNRFKTFTQEVRLQGTAFEGGLDWLVGAYYADENLNVGDNLEYGADYNRFAAGRVALLNPALAAFPLFGFQNLSGFTAAFVNAQITPNPNIPAAVRPLIINAIASQVQNVPLSGTGVNDRYEQHSRNFAAFTHNIINITDQLSLTLGARYTTEKKSLDATLSSNAPCGTYVANINRLRALAASAAANPGGNGGLNAAIAQLAGVLSAPASNTSAGGVFTQGAPLVCVINGVNGSFSDEKEENEWSGTAVLSFKPTEDILTYASYSRGYKAGGFNLDRAPLFSPLTLASSTDLGVLQFDPEKVDAFEVGAKFDGREIDFNIAAFYQMFESFQLNTFDGTNFFVTDIRGCEDDLGTTDEDITPGNSICSETRSGVISKGIELEAFMNPAPDFNVAAGFTLSDTKYREDLAGTPSPYLPANGNSLIPALFLLPGSQLSNAPQYVVTGSATWTPPLSDNLRGLLYADFRYQSEFNTGSDLFAEKAQEGVMLINARAGISTADRGLSLEVWAQNLLDVDYKQVAFNATLQGSNTSAIQTQRFGTPATQLFGAFLSEPRTYGITLRGRF